MVRPKVEEDRPDVTVHLYSVDTYHMSERNFAPRSEHWVCENQHINGVMPFVRLHGHYCERPGGVAEGVRPWRGRRRAGERGQAVDERPQSALCANQDRCTELDHYRILSQLKARFIEDSKLWGEECHGRQMELSVAPGECIGNDVVAARFVFDTKIISQELTDPLVLWNCRQTLVKEKL